MLVADAHPADVDRLTGRGHHPTEAQVEVEAAEQAQLRGGIADEGVAFDGRLTGGRGCRPQLGEAGGQPGGLGLQGLGDAGEQRIVGGDEVRSGFGGQTSGQGEGAGSQRGSWRVNGEVSHPLFTLSGALRQAPCALIS